MSADPSLVRFRTVVEGALAHLEARRQEINDLNVFPVADGDTGDNMALTLRACLAELDRLASGLGDRSLDEIGREEIVQSVARAALLGARGNSGVIPLQLIRGATEQLISRPGQLVDPELIAAAMVSAANQAYTSVRKNPAEGNDAHGHARDGPGGQRRAGPPPGGPQAPRARGDPRRAGRADRRHPRQGPEAGEESLRRGPELLPALREAASSTPAATA